MVAVLRESAEQAGVKTSDLAGIGVGSPGSVDDARRAPCPAQEPLRLGRHASTCARRWSRSSARRSRSATTSTSPTDAEFEIGAAREFDSLLGVFWGTGVGGGIILDGKPWLGRNTAGEIGHMVVKHDGARCPCGRRGCMEAYAGRGAMEARARRRVEKGEKTHLFKIMEERGRDRLSSGIWERALERDDKMAQELLDEAVEALGDGVASAVNLLDPEAVVIGGGLGIRLGEP